MTGLDPAVLRTASAGAVSRQAAGRADPLLATANQFESIFVGMMLNEGLGEAREGSLIGGGTGASVLQGILVETLSEQIADAGGLGIGRRLYESLSEPTETMREGASLETVA